MTPEQKEDLVTTLRQCMKAKKKHHFWLCPKGEDGEPVMLVLRKEGPLRKAAKEERRKAKVKSAAHGMVVVGADGLVFVNEGKVDGGKVLKLFKAKLAPDPDLKKIAPLLRSAQIYTPEEYEALKREPDSGIVEDDGEDPPDSGFEARYAAAREEVALLRSVLGQDPEQGPRVKTLADYLQKAGAEHQRGLEAKGGDARALVEAATAKVKTVVEKAASLVDLAWAAERARLGNASSREQLAPDLGAALQALLAQADAQKTSGKWPDAFATLDQIEDRLSGDSGPEGSAEDWELEPEGYRDEARPDLVLAELERRLVHAEERLERVADEAQAKKIEEPLEAAFAAVEAADLEQARRLAGQVEELLARATAQGGQGPQGASLVELWSQAEDACVGGFDAFVDALLADAELDMVDEDVRKRVEKHLGELRKSRFNLPESVDLRQALRAFDEAQDRASLRAVTLKVLDHYRSSLEQVRELVLIEESGYPLNVIADLGIALGSIRSLVEST